MRRKGTTPYLIEALIRDRKLDAGTATSFLNGSGFTPTRRCAISLEAARTYFVETDEALAEVERILALDEDELTQTMEALSASNGSGPGATATSSPT